jgi:hypothetical protein
MFYSRKEDLRRNREEILEVDLLSGWLILISLDKETFPSEMFEP